MITTAQAPFHEPEDKTLKWLLIFIALSLLLHAIIIAVFLILSHLVPPPKFVEPPPPKENKVALTLVPPPPPVPQKTIFVPTHPQPNAPHVKRPVESAYDAVEQTEAKTAHDPHSILPETPGKKHAPDMHTSQEVKASKTQQPSNTPPTPRQAEPNQSTQQTPSPHPQTSQVQPRPLPPPPKPIPPKPAPPQPQVDPNTGLPVLAPIAAPTLAPQSQSRPLAPAPSPDETAESMRGSMGRAGDTSPAAMATELGKYKQHIYEIVRSYWYPAIDSSFSTIGVGVVHIEFTINKDGTLSGLRVTDGNNQTILRDISLNAMRSPAPYPPFSPAMIKEVGDSYSDEFSFTVY